MPAGSPPLSGVPLRVCAKEVQDLPMSVLLDGVGVATLGQTFQVLGRKLCMIQLRHDNTRFLLPKAGVVLYDGIVWPPLPA